MKSINQITIVPSLRIIPVSYTHLDVYKRQLTDDEKANGVEENIVAIDGIAVITDKDNSVTELTSCLLYTSRCV